MVRFYRRKAEPRPDDLCLLWSGAPPTFRPSPLGWWAPRATLPASVSPGEFLGEVDGLALWSIETEAQEGDTPLRSVMAQASPDQASAAVRAAHLAQWAAEARFCGVCGQPLGWSDAEVSRTCPAGHSVWPRVTPAVIMLVHRGDEVLLARHSKYARPGLRPVFTTLAGFVEAGETLEEAVAREVLEEVGVEVGPPVYQSSQPWPFPSSLMVGFHVPWVSGEPRPDGDEIVEAEWFRASSLPDIPPPPTIARRLIETFFARRPS